MASLPHHRKLSSLRSVKKPVSILVERKKELHPTFGSGPPALPLEATSISFSVEIPMTHVDETRLLAVPSADTRSPKLVVRLFQGQKCQKPWSARGEEWAIRLIRGPELPIGFRY